ncbi:MAG: indole-3-glycerol phosphate synthase TrpC [Desulfobacteraceae bacterium]|nr:indole-3-glycerol phosphate synthase TrpC [Desulfobacteraceae bacterium]
MTDFLSRIIEHKESEVAAAKRLVPETALRSEAESRGPSRRFFDRISKPGPAGMNVIAEIKRASPSKGKIRDDVDPARYARMYEQGGAAAISVLTDCRFFCGSPSDLIAARSASSLPVLRKDFVIGPYQVYESAAMEADCMLLIVRALSPSMLTDLISLGRELGMAALVEVRDKEEFDAALRAGARIIGVNNRDLRTFKTDIETTIALAGRNADGRVMVSESGIGGREDIEQLLRAGVSNFLIGESVMRAEDPVGALRALHGAKDG